MKKRFTDCDRFDDPWFRKLPLKYKALWEFITAKCDNAGVWKVDFELASFMVGDKSLKKEDALELFNNGKERVIAFKDGYWHVAGFIDFQFGGMDGENNFHKQIRSLFLSHGLNEFQGQTRPSLGSLEKEEDKEIEKEESFGKCENLLKNPEKKTSELAQCEKWFDELWQKYPVKDGKKHAKRHFFASVKTAEDFARISAALEVYLGSDRVKNGFIKNASTWFNGWEDWINYKDPKKQETDAEKADRIIANMKAARYAKSV